MSVTEQQTLAIEALVRRRCNELGLTQPELIRRCRYQNVSKGLRRLEQLYSGDFKKSAGLIDKLAVAVNVPVDTINHAVEESRKYLREAEEAAWRAAFRPHAIILTERQIPQPIFVAALIGVDVLLRLDFDLRLAPATFLAQALDGLRQRLRDGAVNFRRSVGLWESSSTTVRIAPSASILKETRSNSSTAPIGWELLSSLSEAAWSLRGSFSR